MAIVAHPDNFHDESQSEEADLVEAGRFDEALERIRWLIE